MSTVNLAYGTKIDLENGEEIICADIKGITRNPKEPVGTWWYTNIVITNKRVVSVPIRHPNPSYSSGQVESWNLKDIKETKKGHSTDGALAEGSTYFSEFAIFTNDGKEINFNIPVAKGIFGFIIKKITKDDEVWKQGGRSSYVKQKNEDFDDIQDIPKRDYLMKLINKYAAAAK